MLASSFRSKFGLGLHRGALALLVTATAVAVGCDKRNLTEVEVPDEGVQLSYDLAPGKAFDGHIRVANSIASPAGEIYNALDFDVALEVVETRGERFFVQATVSELRTDVRLPEGLPKEAGLSQQAAESANGTQLRFYVDRTGEVSDAPQPPEDAALPVKAIVALVSTGLKGAFVKLPPGPIKSGDSWDTTPAEQPAGATASGTGKLEGMAQDADSGHNVAKLEYQSSVHKGQAEGEALAGSLSGSAKALFSQSGYVLSVERRLRGDANGMTLTVNVDAEWETARLTDDGFLDLLRTMRELISRDVRTVPACLEFRRYPAF